MRTSEQHAEKVAQIAAQRLLRAVADADMAPGWRNVSKVRLILGDLTELLAECSGGCKTLVLKYQEWQKLGKEERQSLRKLGVNRTSSYGRCWKCTEVNAATGKSGRKYYGKKISTELRAQIPQIWDEITSDGGGAPELGLHLGVSRERARQVVKELGLPNPDRRGRRTEEFLEELEFLAGFRLGVKEMSEKFGLSPEQFVSKVEHCRVRGLTALSYTNYLHVRNGRNAAA